MNTMFCSNCRFWSDKAAMIDHEHGLVAVCLAPGGFHKGKFTMERFFCHFWRLNKYGAIDEGNDYGQAIQEKYDEDESKE